MLAEAAAGGLSCFSQAYLVSVLARQTLQVGFWQSVHLLYARALEGDVSGSGGIHSAYVRTLLLALSRPNNLSQRNSVRLYRFLDRCSARVRLFLEPQPRGAGGGVFAVRLWSDAPPEPASRTRNLPGCAERVGSDLWRLIWVDVRPLLRHLESIGYESGLPVEVLRHLRWSLSASRPPRSARLDVAMDLKVAVGFDGMRELFEQMPKESDDPISEQQSPLAAVSTRLGSGLVYPDWRAERNCVLGLALKPANLVLSETIEVSAHGVPATASSRTSRLLCCRVLNVGRKGLCLDWPSASFQRISIGQVIGLKFVAGQAAKAIGLVRWVGPSRTSNGGLSVGVELVRPMDSVPLTVSLSPSLTAFWIPEEDGNKGVVVAPPGRLDVGSGIAVSQSGQPLQITLTGIRESTSACTCFDAQLA